MWGHKPPSLTDTAVLRRLHGGQTLRGIADHLGVAPNAVRKRVKRLTLAGYVKKVAVPANATPTLTFAGVTFLRAHDAANPQGANVGLSARVHRYRFAAPVIQGPVARVAAAHESLHATVTTMRAWARLDGRLSYGDHAVAYQIGPRTARVFVPDFEGCLDDALRFAIAVVERAQALLVGAGYILGDFCPEPGVHLAVPLHPAAVAWQADTGRTHGDLVRHATTGQRLIWADRSTGVMELECESVMVLRAIVNTPFGAGTSWRDWLLRVVSAAGMPPAVVL